MEDGFGGDNRFLYIIFSKYNYHNKFLSFKDPSEYKKVWQSLFNYFCNEKNLHNLILLSEKLSSECGVDPDDEYD